MLPPIRNYSHAPFVFVCVLSLHCNAIHNVCTIQVCARIYKFNVKLSDILSLNSAKNVDQKNFNTTKFRM